MTRVAGDGAAFLAIAQALAAKAGNATLPLWNGQQAQAWAVKNAVPGIAQVLTRFYLANGRAPAVLFNDGKPAQYLAQLQAQPGFGQVLSWVFLDDSATNGAGTIGFPVFALPVLLARPFTYTRTSYQGENQIPVDTAVTLSGAINTRWLADNSTAIYPSFVPLDNITAGAAPTWLVWIVAATHPEFLTATDAGIVLTPAGIAMVERSLPAWIGERIRQAHPESVPLGLTAAQLTSVLGDGPVTMGLPSALLDKFLAAYENARSQTLVKTVLLDLAKWIGSFMGLYFGAGALASMLAGSFTISGLSASVSLAKQFGVDTGSVGQALSLANLTQRLIPDNVGAFNGSTMLDWQNLPPGGVDVSLADLGAGSFSLSGSGWNTGDWGSSNVSGSDWASFDPATELGSLDFKLDGFDSSISLSGNIFQSPSAIPDTVMQMDGNGLITLPPLGSLDPLDISFGLTGGSFSITPDEAAAVAAAPNSPDVQAAARQRVMSSLNVTPQQAASTPGLMDVIDKMSGDAIKLAQAYWTLSHGPTNTGALLSNGARVQTLANGTRTITYPNGQVVTLPAASTSLVPGISNQTLAIGGAVVLGAVMLLGSRRSRGI